VALLLVMGVVAVMIPLLIFFSMIGGAHTRQAVHHHERMTTEAGAWSGIEAGLARLQGNGGAQQFTGTLSRTDFTVYLNPTGVGMASQTMFQIFGKSVLGRYQYVFMVACEQFPRSLVAPSDPNVVVPHDFWGTVEPYDITQAADCSSIENARGLDLLARETALTYELSTPAANYQTEMLGKATGLPPELRARWNDIALVLVQQKATPLP
jgi:hypothetical protein